MSSTTCREGVAGGGASRLRGWPRSRLARIGPEDSRTDPPVVITGDDQEVDYGRSVPSEPRGNRIRIRVVIHNSLVRLVLRPIPGITLAEYRRCFPPARNCHLNQVRALPGKQAALLHFNEPLTDRWALSDVAVGCARP